MSRFSNPNYGNHDNSENPEKLDKALRGYAAKHNKPVNKARVYSKAGFKSDKAINNKKVDAKIRSRELLISRVNEYMKRKYIIRKDVKMLLEDLEPHREDTDFITSLVEKNEFASALTYANLMIKSLNLQTGLIEMVEAYTSFSACLQAKKHFEEGIDLFNYCKNAIYSELENPNVRSLEEQLETAIKRENYEGAAELRDKINSVTTLHQIF